MRRSLYLWAAFGFVSLGATHLWAGGGYHLSGEVLRALAGPTDQPLPVQELRAAGPAALDELFRLRDLLTRRVSTKLDEPSPETAEISRRLVRLDELIDQVGMQRYCSRSRLYWHTDLESAQAAARESGKPILSLRMLGNLNEEFSCANSRFFRTTLYANEEISKTLRENYVLHWKSVRPVPKVTIDFGDGRKLERTLTGNSIHYILTPDGDVVEALPGLYGPQAFLRKINDGASLTRQVAALPADQRASALATYHGEQYARLGEAFAKDLASIGTPAVSQYLQPQATSAALPPRADVAALVARPKGRVEMPLVRAALPGVAPADLQEETAWRAIASLHAEESLLDKASRELVRSQNPTAALAGRLSITKRVVEDPLLRMVRSLQESIALDSVRNEYQLHQQIHLWLADASYRPAVDVLNERVYAELFLTPSSDPWLGLAGADVYTALPNGGVVLGAK